MKIFCILGLGRSGVDFLQSLFDSHPNISQFPGYFFYDQFWKEIESVENPEIIAETFIKRHQRFFNSKIYLIERHNQLGDWKNDSFIINKNKFKKKFIELQKIISKRSILINLHCAYSYASGEDIKKKKIIVINIHNINHLKNIKDLDFEIFFSIRHPISSLSSGFKHWLNYSPKNVDNWFLNYQINRIYNGIKNCLALKKKIYIVRLDLLHTKNKSIMMKICKKMKIKYNKILSKSTYHNLRWWGDKLSNKYLNGINNNFKDTYDSNFFFNKDIQYLEFYLTPFIKKYKLKNFSKAKIMKFKKILPLKIELILWKKLIYNFNFTQIFLIPFYWAKRIILIEKSYNKKINYPEMIK